MTTTPPRLFVLARPDSTTAVVIRQGPSRVFCTIGWDLATDAFVVGQWCKHKLYPERCDVSSDGRFLVYFALDGAWSSETQGAWTAVSLTPYLKAIKLWPQGHTWGGGGLFYRDQLQLAEGHREGWDRLETFGGGDRLASGDVAERARRDGWTKTSDGRHKELRAGWRLRMKLSGPSRYALVDPNGDVQPRTDWRWADVDVPRKRVLWAEAGVIYGAPIHGHGLGVSTTLFDARGMTFEAREAPYDAPTVITRRA